MLSRIRIVLVETSHPGNIGAAARAMKNMELARLYLMQPKLYPNADATARASGADDVLAQAVVCASLDEALADCALVLGMSARARSLSWPRLDAREAGRLAAQESARSEVALVFGREHSGLTNEELERCHFLVQIPGNPAYSSLNLAAAVQVLAYEVLVAERSAADAPVGPVEPTDLATAEDVEHFHRHLERVLLELEFLDPAQPRQLMRRLRRLFNRVRLDRNEVNILRGILTAMERRLRG